MEEMRGMEEIVSEEMISPVTHMLSAKVVAVYLLECPGRGVRYWLEFSSVLMPSPTLFRAI